MSYQPQLSERIGAASMPMWTRTPPGSSTEPIGASARALDELSLIERARLGRATLNKLLLIGGGYIALVALSIFLINDPAEPQRLWEISAVLIPTVILLAFLFETMDSAAGMGFGTALAPLLFVLGYDPLAVVPVLLIAEAVTGLTCAMVHHEFENVRFSFTLPLGDATKMMLLIAAAGIIGIVSSVMLAYLAFSLSDAFIETYVTVLVLSMGVMALIRRYLNSTTAYRPKRMIGFAALAGFNKGIGGGGYGPVVTLGQIYSGIYEKSAAGITSFAEALVSIAGAFTFFAITAAGVDIDFTLLPSILAGSILAAILSPYMVRILPNRILSYLIPMYAIAIGLVAFAGLSSA